MYEAILVCRMGIYEKAHAGSILCDNIGESYVKVIPGTSPEECRRKAEDFLNENQFLSLRDKGVKNANR